MRAVWFALFGLLFQLLLPLVHPAQALGTPHVMPAGAILVCTGQGIQALPTADETSGGTAYACPDCAMALPLAFGLPPTAGSDLGCGQVASPAPDLPPEPIAKAAQRRLSGAPRGPPAAI
jgi:hypothetical protein